MCYAVRFYVISTLVRLFNAEVSFLSLYLSQYVNIGRPYLSQEVNIGRWYSGVYINVGHLIVNVSRLYLTAQINIGHLHFRFNVSSRHLYMAL